METGTKRKSSESTDCDESKPKKVCKSSAHDGGMGDSQENVRVGINLDNTQEYELEDSDGFEFDNTNTLIDNGDTKDYGTLESTDKPSLMKEKTEEYAVENETAKALNERETSAARTQKDATATALTSSNANGQAIEKTTKCSNCDTLHDEGAGTSGVTNADNNSENIKHSLSKIASVQRDAEIISNVIPTVDLKALYSQVLQQRHKANRVDIVTNKVLENMTGMGTDADPNAATGDDSSESIFKDVAVVIAKVPNADPNKVFDLLEKLEGKPDRVTETVNKLSGIKNTASSDTAKEQKPVASVKTKNKEVEAFSDPAFKKNPLYGDLKTLRKVLPERDPNEIYAFLEAHFEKPNRVQIVIDELTKSDSQESIPVVPYESLDETDKGKAPMTAEDKLQHDLKELKEIFSDCDPNFLYEKLDALPYDADRVEKIAAELFEKKTYPKLKDVLEKVQKDKQRERCKKLEFKLGEFLQKFPSPVTYFGDTERLVNENYKAHAVVYLKNTYPYLKDGYIKKVLENSKHHLSPAVAEVEEEIEYIMEARQSKKKRATPREETLEYPDDLEELFFQEVMFCQHRQQIKDHLDEVKRVRDLKVTQAREDGELQECGCCFDDECLFEEMQACADGHIFCKECILRSSEAAIGEGRTKFPCLTGTCEQQFPLHVLQDILPSNLFSLALRKMQEEELRQADIPDLVSCPFCSFATVMPNQEDKVLRCLNPDCLRESCRLCKEPNHVPLRCSEVEKQGETNMRTYIETKMSEAMLRTCPTCKKRFYKESGCNKMTCTCGTTMCYICREAHIDYGHFDSGKCDLSMDIFTMHKEEMLEAAEKAKQEYLKDHPDQGEDLKYDPVKLLEKLKNRWEGGGDDGDDNDYDEDDDDDYDE